MAYKNLLFIYLFIVGFLIFFCNCKMIGPVYFSATVLALHTIFMLALIRIQPYKQSLKVHTVTLIFNNLMVLVFLAVINLLNYV